MKKLALFVAAAFAAVSFFSCESTEPVADLNAESVETSDAVEAAEEEIELTEEEAQAIADGWAK